MILKINASAWIMQLPPSFLNPSFIKYKALTGVLHFLKVPFSCIVAFRSQPFAIDANEVDFSSFSSSHV